MLSILARGIRKWGVAVAGLLLILCGVSAMLTGWDQILIERGWSLFIAGATLIAGGSVTTAIGIALARFEALNALDAGVRRTAGEPAVKARAAPEARVDARAQAEEIFDAEATAASLEERGSAVAPQNASNEAGAPTIIDRYESGGAAYVMYSDGSVEVRTELETRRYASVADLRADLDP